MFFLKVQIDDVMHHVCHILFVCSFLVDKSDCVVAHRHKTRQKHEKKRKRYSKQRINGEKCTCYDVIGHAQTEGIWERPMG